MRALKISNLLKGQSGFSLTEIMIGGGILAGVALAGAQLFKDQKLAQRKVDQQQKLTIFHQGLTKKMQIASNCNATMKGAGLVGATIPANFVFPRLSLCGGNCDEAAGAQDHRATNVGVGAALLTPGGYTDNTRVWLVDSIIHPSAARSTTGPTILRIKYRMDPKLVNGSNSATETKDIVVNARFHNGVLQECVSAQESSVNNLQNDFCRTLNMNTTQTIDSTGANVGNMAYWDEEKQTCVVGTNKDCSGQGWIVDGVDTNGEVKCKRITTPHDADIMQDTSNTTCGAGQQANLRYDSATKKFKIVCQ